MATAVSMKSESGDDYLFLYSGNEQIFTIIGDIQKRTGQEFGYLSTTLIESTSVDPDRLRKELRKELSLHTPTE